MQRMIVLQGFTRDTEASDKDYPPLPILLSGFDQER